MASSGHSRHTDALAAALLEMRRRNRHMRRLEGRERQGRILYARLLGTVPRIMPHLPARVALDVLNTYGNAGRVSIKQSTHRKGWGEGIDAPTATDTSGERGSQDEHGGRAPPPTPDRQTKYKHWLERGRERRIVDGPKNHLRRPNKTPIDTHSTGSGETASDHCTLHTSFVWSRLTCGVCSTSSSSSGR